MFQQGRFNNIFREDDKTSRMIFNEARRLTEYNQWRTIFISRYINRNDRLAKLYPFEKDLSSQINRELNPKEAYTNSCAYQLHSGIGKIFGVKGAKDALHHIDSVIPKTYSILNTKSSIEELTYMVNSAFGGCINFLAFQAILDWAQLNNHIDVLESTPYTGIGASATETAIGMDATELAATQPQLWPEAKRKMYPFDAENLMCEFRKYQKRTQEGIQSATSKYRPNFLGTESESK